MATRMFRQMIKTGTPELILLTGQLTIGASGAVTACSIPFASAAKSATGTILITLEDSYVALQSVQLTLKSSTAVAAQLLHKADDVVTAKTVTILCTDGAGTPAAADLASGAVINVTIVLRNSTVSI